MSEIGEKADSWPAAIALVTVKFLDKGGVWAALLAIAMLSGGLNRFLDLVKDLLAAGPVHFWAFVVTTLVALALIAMMRRQALAVQELAARVRRLAGDNERLMRALEQRPTPLLPGPVEHAADTAGSTVLQIEDRSSQ